MIYCLRLIDDFGCKTVSLQASVRLMSTRKVHHLRHAKNKNTKEKKHAKKKHLNRNRPILAKKNDQRRATQKN